MASLLTNVDGLTRRRQRAAFRSAMSRTDEARRCNELGDALRASGRVTEAFAAYERGLDADPANIPLHMSFGTFALAQGDRDGAAASYRRILTLAPAHREARIRLAHVLRLNAEFTAAADLLRALAADFPADPIAFKEFGKLYFEQQNFEAAFTSFQAALQLSPRDADSHHWLANIEHLRGNADAALQHYRRTIELKPLMRVPGTKQPPDFSALFLFAPGRANTPHDTLISAARYDSTFILLLPDVDYDVEALRKKGNIVVNLISDVDQGQDLLNDAQTLVDRLALPVVNHPRNVLMTDRESVAARLSGIDWCCVPAVRRFAADPTAQDISALQWPFPMLIRVAGTHGGDTFEKADDRASIEAFLDGHGGASIYVTQYVDYRSNDGFFRKYRFFCVGDELLPYHLAIGHGWKVHHAATEMADQPWMQREEEAFLNDPSSTFGPAHLAALGAIRTIIGLEFFGIDCGIDRQNSLVVFEVNASMLVHQSNERFPYKAPAVERIKRAFNLLLNRLAAGA